MQVDDMNFADSTVISHSPQQNCLIASLQDKGCFPAMTML